MEQEELYTEQEPLPKSGDHFIKPVEPKEQKAHIEQFQEGLNRLTDQLQGIHERLGQQVAQHQRLIESIDNFPVHLRDLPDLLDKQQKASTNMLEQVEIQTDTLERMDHRLALAGDLESRQTNNMASMAEAIQMMCAQGSNQANTLDEIYRSLFTGEQYMKHVLSVQIRRLTWMWGISLLICLSVLAFVIYSSLV
jgi:hypothetical protein